VDSLAHLEPGELVQRLRESDQAAYGELFDRFHQPLFRYAARIVSREDALDVTQDVFARLWEMREALAVRVSLQSLLYRMTRNRSTTPEDDSDPALQAALRLWIEQLPPRRAEAFTLSRYHDLSHEQISRIMGLSVRTVQTHIVHALRDLRTRMETWNRPAASAELS
jgi:RNA polymerase sigma-70 factor (ECF subfamily)